MVNIKINSKDISTESGKSILTSALDSDIYIPHICSHPDLEPIADSDSQIADIIYQGNNPFKSTHPKNLSAKEILNGCQLCLVEIKGINELQRACATMVVEGMEIFTDTERIRQARQENLAKILSEHPHSCLTCAQSEGCSLTQCSSNVPQNERCCHKFGRCELEKVSQYVGIPLTTSRYTPQNITLIENDLLFKRNYNLCIGCLRCVRACRNLRGVDALGFVVNDGKVIVGSRQPTLKDSGCKFCGACVEVCPTGAILDKIIIGADRIKSLVPCQSACPVGMDVPSYIRLIKEDRIKEAFEVIQHKVPLPSVLGRVCFHPCEENCRRKEVNEPIAICNLKRYATECVTHQNNPQSARSLSRLQRDNPQSPIAIIGGGPSGLTAAYYLAQKGYSVSVFEANNEVGGMMRYAIPEYRLPLSVLSNDLNKITKHPNITIKTNSKLGMDFTIESLKKEGYTAILIAIGAQLPKKINLQSKESNESKKSDSIDSSDSVNSLDSILWGINFLKDIRNGKIQTSKFKDKNILVIGGGNVAIDAALSAGRLGAENIQLVCLESRETMPAHKWEIEQASEEGIILNCSWGPKEIRNANCELGIGNSGNPKSAIRNTKFAIDFVQCTSVFDASGNFNPSFNTNICKTFQADIVIITIGQVPDTEELKNPASPESGCVINSITKEQITLNPNKTIRVDEDTLAVQESVFACGEAVHNPSSIVESIADGRKAAENIDKYLGAARPDVAGEPRPVGRGDGVIDSLLEIAKANPYLGRDESFAGYQRIKMPCINLDDRNNNFNPVESGYTKEMAQNEAKRCLQCDMRLTISPVIFPPETSRKGHVQELEFNAGNIKTAPAKEGVYILMDENKNTIVIKGVMNLQEALLEQATNSKAKYFQYEIDPMYTKKESELIQQYLQKYGKLPSGGDELEDLY